MDRSRRSRQQSGNRAIDEAIAQVAGPSGLARVRPGVLFSTAGFTINAAGLPNITEVNAFTVGLGTADPGTGVALTRALTNLQAPGKVEASKAFVAHSLSVRPIFFTRVAGIDLTIHQQYLLDLVERTGITLAIVSDVQRMGNPNHWPGAGYAPMNSLGALAAGAQAAAGGGVNQVGGGRLDRQLALHEPYVFDADTVMAMSFAINPVPAAIVGLATGVVMFQPTFYGYEIQKVVG